MYEVCNRNRSLLDIKNIFEQNIWPIAAATDLWGGCNQNYERLRSNVNSRIAHKFWFASHPTDRVAALSPDVLLGHMFFDIVTKLRLRLRTLRTCGSIRWYQHVQAPSIIAVRSRLNW